MVGRRLFGEAILMLIFYRYIFEIFYRWGYNSRVREEINHPENTALPTVAALTCFNIFSLIIALRIIFMRENDLFPVKYEVFLGLGMFALLYVIYYFAFVSQGKKNQNKGEYFFNNLYFSIFCFIYIPCNNKNIITYSSK